MLLSGCCPLDQCNFSGARGDSSSFNRRMNICSQRSPTARGGQWTIMCRATKESWGTIELLEKAFLEISEGLCMVSAIQETTKGCWTERKAKRNHPVLTGCKWKEDLFSRLSFNRSHPAILSFPSGKNCHVPAYYFWILLKYASRDWKPSVSFGMCSFGELLCFSGGAIPTQDTGFLGIPSHKVLSCLEVMTHHF